jgi:hypothetical protein
MGRKSGSDCNVWMSRKPAGGGGGGGGDTAVDVAEASRLRKADNSTPNPVKPKADI